jgi:protein SCO1/2
MPRLTRARRVRPARTSRWLGLASALALALSLALSLAGCGGGSATGAGSTSPARPGDGFRIADPQPAPELALRDQTGVLVRLSELRGKTVVIAFLYTHCPDVCPLIAENVNQALRGLTPDERAGVRVLAVSVDPLGDTPAAVSSYVAIQRLLPEFRYLTGSRADLVKVWQDYGVAAVASSPGLVDHSAYELLVDSKGIGRVRYDTAIRADALLADLRALAR